MTTRSACRRRHRRHRFRDDGSSRLEFVYPQPNGAQRDVALLDISPSGFSFEVPDELLSLDQGSTVQGITLRFSNCELRGDMLVVHVTRERGVAGALFYPASDLDLVKLRTAVAALEAVAAD